jgi:hypothetical protein
MSVGDVDFIGIEVKRRKARNTVISVGIDDQGELVIGHGEAGMSMPGDDEFLFHKVTSLGTDRKIVTTQFYLFPIIPAIFERSDNAL